MKTSAERIVSIINVDYSHLCKTLSDVYIEQLKEAAYSLSIHDYCTKYMEHFSDVAQTQLLCMKCDVMFDTSMKTVYCYTRWKDYIR